MRGFLKYLDIKFAERKQLISMRHNRAVVRWCDSLLLSIWVVFPGRLIMERNCPS